MAAHAVGVTFIPLVVEGGARRPFRPLSESVAFRCSVWAALDSLSYILDSYIGHEEETSLQMQSAVASCLNVHITADMYRCMNGPFTITSFWGGGGGGIDH